MRYGPFTCIVVAALLLLTGCASSGSTPNGSFNDDDVMFLQMMIQHNGQGIRIARLAEKRAVRPDVTTLAAAIDTTQVAEVKTMAGRLRGWHKPPVALAHSHTAHGGMVMTRESEITKLSTKNGPDFERRFLDMMVAHQDDALQMARREVATGIDPQSKGLAQRFIKSRTGEIDQMLKFLGPGAGPNASPNPSTNPSTNPSASPSQSPGQITDKAQAGQ
ncbi:DUF305 domain-containing protein [Actinomadura barringtoniae]|uniref:DUF305 domain-containing protein n=1 Tax=Actinomadura barringtoniae TaxID=1427535 RepID=UPI001FB6A6D0|nr:DUF305 domain-containing protein [Actinomadura barringtoniae]